MRSLVFGAGPAGSGAAAEISALGHDVALIERDSYAGETNVCGAVTPKSNSDAFEVPGQVIERTLSRWTCYFPEETFTFDVPFSSFQRCKFDRWLSERAVSKGAQLFTNTVATDVSVEEEGATVRLRNRKENREFEMKTKIVVFADGPDTLAAKKFPGVGFQRRPQRTMHGLVYEYEDVDNTLDSFDLYFDRKIASWGYGWLFPKKDILNVGMGGLLATAQKDGGGSNRGRLDYMVKNHPVCSRKVQGKKIERIQAAIIPVEQAHKIFGRRMLLVGDAAGMVEPFSAGGNEYAMRGGQMAGRKAAEALDKGRFDEPFLSSYASEWARSADGKTLASMQRYFSLGYMYYKINKNAGLKFYSYFFHKVADLLSKGQSAPAHTIQVPATAAA